jgi:predicted ATP-dependent protease
MDRPRHLLVVETPQIRHRTTASTDDQHIYVRRQPINRLRDLSWRLRTLHRAVGNQDAHPAPSRRHLQDVLQRRPALRGRNPDDARKAWQRPLARRVEQAFPGQPGLQLLELRQQLTLARQQHLFDVELKAPLFLIDGQPPTQPLVVTADDVAAAWQERRERLASEERHIRELTLRGEVALDTTGMRVGVVNGLSVFHTGDVEFGQPMRITAVVALGREGIVDVEREAQLGGAIHTKGVAILRGYLARMFGQERPLSLRAQLVFEQSYGEIDGDSASSSELFAVLSALADVGIDQSIAVTGSVNQLGEMQAIGGVCAKIEGFFDLCHARGLTGSQGVMIPKANLPHLVMRDDVVHAIQRGQFHVYTISSVAEGIEVLTGLPAGERDATGRFPAASVFGRVERRIIEIAERLRQAEAHGYDGGMDGIEDGAAEIGEAGEFRRLTRPTLGPPASGRRLLPSR